MDQCLRKRPGPFEQRADYVEFRIAGPCHIWLKRKPVAASHANSERNEIVNGTNGQKAQLPYELVGGEEAVRRFVDRFYNLMETDPCYAELRQLHAKDLQPMRDSLTGFLTAWLGGPRDWFAKRPGACVMSAHADVPVSRKTAEQWTAAMARALADSGVDPALGEAINTAFARMAMAMAQR